MFERVNFVVPSRERPLDSRDNPVMTEYMTSAQFHDDDTLADWRVLFDGVQAHFRTGSFAAGVVLVDAIGRLTAEADVDLRGHGVTVRFAVGVDGLPAGHAELARQVSAAAAELGTPADPASMQVVQLAMDALDRPVIMPFWRAVLGYADLGPEDVVDPRGCGPSIWFQDMDTPREQRNRIHVDVCVPHDQAEARVAAALAAGGRLVSDQNAPQWWTLADPEGNEVDVATMLGRD